MKPYREVWPQTAHFAARKVRRLERLLGHLGRGAVVLDLGCGIGEAAQRAARHWRVVGIDPDRSHLEAASPGMTRLLGRGDALPFATGSFAAAYAFCVLHHIRPVDRDACARELARVLAPGGRLIVWEHNPANPVTRRVVADCALDRDAVLLAPDEVRELLARAGLGLEGCRFATFFPPRLGMLAPLESALGWLPLGAQYYVVGKKMEKTD